MRTFVIVAAISTLLASTAQAQRNEKCETLTDEQTRQLSERRPDLGDMMKIMGSGKKMVCRLCFLTRPDNTTRERPECYFVDKRVS